MAAKKKSNNDNSARRWTKDEVELFAQVLADPTDGFAHAIDKLALKKSANNEVYEHLQAEFRKQLEKDDFVKVNELNFIDKKTGKKIPHKKLDISISRLRNKFKMLKSEWTNLNSRIKHGSGLAASDEPAWFKHIDPVFSETNEDFTLTSSAQETSFVQDGADFSDESSEDGEISTDRDAEVRTDGMPVRGRVDVDEQDDEPQQEQPDEEANRKRKTVVAPHKKPKQIRSNKQALSEIASGLKALADTTVKQHQMMIDADAKREERYMEFRREESEKNREHELRLAEILSRNRQPPPPAAPYYQFPMANIPNSSSTPDAVDPYQPHQEVESTPQKQRSWNFY